MIAHRMVDQGVKEQVLKLDEQGMSGVVAMCHSMSRDDSLM